MIRCLVVAGDWDEQTGFIRPGADTALTALNALPDHDTCALFDAQGTRLNFQARVAEFGPVHLGVFFCHGNDEGLWQQFTPPTTYAGEILRDLDAQCFDRAILVMFACLKTGQLPVNLTNQPHVRAVIGYLSLLLIAIDPSHLQDPSGQPYATYREVFLDTLLTPLHSLLNGQSVQAATDAGKRQWNQLAQQQKRWELQTALWANGKSLNYWPEDRGDACHPP